MVRTCDKTEAVFRRTLRKAVQQGRSVCRGLRSRLSLADFFSIPRYKTTNVGPHCTETPTPLQSVRKTIPVGVGFSDIECVEINLYHYTRLPEQLSDQTERQPDHSQKISIDGIDQIYAPSLNRIGACLAETFPSGQITFMHPLIERFHPNDNCRQGNDLRFTA